MPKASRTHAAQAGATPRGIRMVLGGLVLGLSLGALAWSLLIAGTEYRYRQLRATEPPDLENNRPEHGEFLARYAIELENLLRSDPVNGGIRNRYATVLSLMRDYEEAVRQAEMGRSIENVQQSLYFLAVLQERLGNEERAHELMNDCCIINPTNMQFNAARLRLLNREMDRFKEKTRSGGKVDNAAYRQARLAFGQATRAWAVRAPHDPNSHLFMGNMYVEPLYPLQAYRFYLMGLSRAPSMRQDLDLLIEPSLALRTVDQILSGNYAKPYKGLP